MLSCHVSQGLLTGLFSFRSLNHILFAFLSYSMHTICHTHFILLIIFSILLLFPLQIKCFHHICETPPVCVTAKFHAPYKTTGKITVLYILIIRLLDRT